jgi:hypothetical protein
MKVRIVGQPAGSNKGKAWENGQVVDVDDERAQAMVGAGHAVPVDLDAVVETPSRLVAEAEARQAYAETEYATPQEKRQAAVERQADERGVNARLHQADLPTLAVADEQHAKAIAVDGGELWANKGPVEARPDSAGVEGVPSRPLAEAVSATSGPVEVTSISSATDSIKTARPKTADKPAKESDR